MNELKFAAILLCLFSLLSFAKGPSPLHNKDHLSVSLINLQKISRSN